MLNRLGKTFWSIVVGIIIGTGSGLAWLMVAHADHEMRDDLTQRALLIEHAIDIDLVKALKGNLADLRSPNYLRLKEQLVAIRNLYPNDRFFYLLGQNVGGKAFFFADSEPTDSKDYSPPGQLYDEASEICRRVSDSKSVQVVGPFKDRWGTWITALVPVIDPATNKLIAVFGTYVDARAWKRLFALAALPPLLLMLGLLTVMGLGKYLAARLSRHSGSPAARIRRLEMSLVVAVGFVVTTFAVWTVYGHESRNRALSFKSLALSTTAGLEEFLRELHNYNLEGLACFCANKDELTAESFRDYTGYLTRTPVVQAWEWVPAVPVSARSRFEEEARAAGCPASGIWQRDAEGRPVPAFGREVYYPVFCAAPARGNELAVGYDLGSEPVRRAALEHAALTGLTTGTEPVTLVQETEHQRGMLLFRPVYSGSEPKRLRGFALAVLRLGAMLNCALPYNKAMSISLSLLKKDGSLESLATTDDEVDTSRSNASESRPIAIFGKVFVVTASPGPKFERMHHPVQSGMLAGIIGVLFTAVAVILLHMILWRQEELECLVAERTSEFKESEERHRAMFEKNRSVKFLVDPSDGSIMDANAAASEYYGYSREQLRCMNIKSINTLPADELCEKMEATLSKGNGIFQFRHRLSDGRIRDVEVLSSPLTVKGRPYLYSIVHDVTERRLAEQVVARLSEIRRHLMLLATDFVNVPLERQDEAIAQALATFGGLMRADRAYLFEHDAAKGMMSTCHMWRDEKASPLAHALRRVPLELVPAWIEMLRRGEQVYVARVAELPHDDQIRAILSGGGFKSLIALPLMSPGGCLGFVGFDSVSHECEWGPDEIALLQGLAEVFANFRMKRLAEIELRQVNADRGMLLDTMSAQVWYLTDPETYGLANRAHADFIGLPLARIQHKRLREFLPPDVAAVCIESNSKVFETRAAVRTREWVKFGSDEGRLIEIFKNPCVGADGHVAYVVCVGHDITEEQQMRTELILSKDKAERTARAKATFLATMSHEIRTPLNVILGYAQIMNRECSGCQHSRNMQSIEKSGEHLLELINDLLSVSQRDQWSVPLNESKFDLLRLAEDVRLLFSRHPDAHGLSFDLHADADVPRCLLSDKGKIRQVLLNLLGNAVKFTEHGFVRMRISKISEERVYLAACERADRSVCKIAVEVEDSGRGISADRIDGVFEAFGALDGAPVKQKGSGIGLALSKRYAQALGGDLTVTSRLGEGSVFRFVFCASVASEASARQAPKKAFLKLGNGGRPPRVLIVDDNVDGLEMQSAMLRSVGFETALAEDGLRALEKLRTEEPYQVILLDYLMPGIDGLETLTRIRELPKGQDIPILIVTGSEVSDKLETIRRLGGNGVLSRPVEMGCLLEEIRRVTGVSYESAGQAESAGAIEPEQIITPKLLSLPEGTRSILLSAMHCGDIASLRAAVRELAATAPEAANALEPLVGAYDYRGLARLLKNMGTAEPESGLNATQEQR